MLEIALAFVFFIATFLIVGFTMAVLLAYVARNQQPEIHVYNSEADYDFDAFLDSVNGEDAS